MKLKVKNWLIFGIILFIFLTFEIIFLFLGYDFNNLSYNNTLLMIYTKYFVFVFFFLIYYHQYLKDKWLDFKLNFKKYAKIAFKDWFTGLIIMYTTNIIIMRIIGTTGQNEEAVQNIIHYTPLIAFTLTTLFAPFIEEMIFRKTLQDCFHNQTLFMLSSGFIFGLIHVLGGTTLEYLLIIPYGALGVMFAHTLNKTNNIYATIMVHAIHNGALTLLSVMVSKL